MGCRRSLWSCALAALSAQLFLVGCPSEAEPGNAGTDCFRALDCAVGLICVEGKCTSDIGPLVPEGGVPTFGAGGAPAPRGGGNNSGNGNAGMPAAAGAPPTGGGAPPGPSGPSAAATQFCDSYLPTCTFGGGARYQDADDCAAKFDGFDADRQACVQQHLQLALDDAATHCPHATGQAPCN